MKEAKVATKTKRAHKKGRDGQRTIPLAAAREAKAAGTGSRQNRALVFLREARSELHKVTWPTRQEAINLTMIVIATSAAVGLLLGGIDVLLGQFFRLLIK